MFIESRNLRDRLRHQSNSMNIDVESIARISNDDQDESSNQFDSQINELVENVDLAIDTFFETNFSIDYATLLKREKTKTKKLKQKREYKVIMIQNKLLSTSIRVDEVISKSRRRSRELDSNEESKSQIIRNANDERELDDVSFLKRQRFDLFLKSYNLKSYFEKFLKKHKKWTRSVVRNFELSSNYFSNEEKKINFVVIWLRDTSTTRWKIYENAHSNLFDTWIWKNFNDYLLNLIENSKNRRLIIFMKYLNAH